MNSLKRKASLDARGSVLIERGTDTIRLTGNGQELLLEAETLSALRRAARGLSLRETSQMAAEFLQAGDLALRIAVGGRTIATAPAEPNSVAKLAGLSRVHVRLGAFLRTLVM